MQLPFARFEFLDVFAAYNRAYWPAVLALWLLTAVALWRVHRGHPGASRFLSGTLALQWGWAGVVYHWLHFRAINPAAGLFGGLFIIEAGIILWLSVLRRQLTFRIGNSGRDRLALALLVFALLYPIVGLLTGLSYPRLPTFGVPCPTTILTIGALLLAPRPAGRRAGVIPFLWAVVGGSAAFALRIGADWALLLAGGALLLHLFGPEPTAGARAA